MQKFSDALCGKCKLPPVFHAVTTHGRKLTLVSSTGTVAHPFRFTEGGGNGKAQR